MNEHSPTTSKEHKRHVEYNGVHRHESCKERYYRYIYDRDKKLFCERTCKSWFIIVAYSIMFIILLCTFTKICLYCVLLIIKHSSNPEVSEKINLFTYKEKGIGLSATPTSLHIQPIIWYSNEEKDYQKYVKSIENLLGQRKNNDTNIALGSCGTPPYGYGDKPCIILRINKQLKWSAKPLSANSSNAKNIPSIVRKWMKVDKEKLWLFCTGYNSYDKEHVKSIKYYPDPPGFDAKLFPLNLKNDSPLIAVQITDFTFKVSLTIQCSLWYEGGVSTAEFFLYVTGQKRERRDIVDL